jgi:hypothetical protein
MKGYRSKNTAGFTLLEVIVTGVIGSMLVAIGGLLLVNMNIFMIAGETAVEQTADFRAGKQMIAASLREAVTITTALPSSSINFVDFNAANRSITLNGTNIFVDQDFVIGDVTSLSFDWATVPFPVVHQSTHAVQVQLIQLKVTSANTGAVVTSSGSFIVQLRNIR